MGQPGNPYPQSKKKQLLWKKIQAFKKGPGMMRPPRRSQSPLQRLIRAHKSPNPCRHHLRTSTWGENPGLDLGIDDLGVRWGEKPEEEKTDFSVEGARIRVSSRSEACPERVEERGQRGRSGG